MSDLAKFLKLIRGQSNLGQKDVALRLGYSTSQFISNWERGLSRPPIEALPILAELYQIPLRTLQEYFYRDSLDALAVELRQAFSWESVT